MLLPLPKKSSVEHSAENGLDGESEMRFSFDNRNLLPTGMLSIVGKVAKIDSDE
jgi:hypothetical protein